MSVDVYVRTYLSSVYYLGDDLRYEGGIDKGGWQARIESIDVIIATDLHNIQAIGERGLCWSPYIPFHYITFIRLSSLSLCLIWILSLNQELQA